MNHLNVSGATYRYRHIFAQQNVYGVSFLPAFDPSVPNKSINISTRGTENLNLNAIGSGNLICYVSGTSRMIVNNNNVSINSSLNVSGATILNNRVSCLSTSNVVGDTIHPVYQYSQ